LIRSTETSALMPKQCFGASHGRVGDHARRSRNLDALLPPATLRERRHRILARRLVAVGRRAVLMLPEGERPPKANLRATPAAFMMRPTMTPRRQDVVVVGAPFTGWART
jgi:hypothetical protein